LHGIPELSDIERSYAEGVFQNALKDGISKEELKKNYGLKIDCCTDCDKPIAWCVNTVLRINKAKEPEV